MTALGLITIMPVSEFARSLSPAPPQRSCASADKLSYRSFLTVCLIVDSDRPLSRQLDLCPSTGGHGSPASRISRTGARRWCPTRLEDQPRSGIFLSEGDDLWTMQDADLIELGKRELERIGLAECVISWMVVCSACRKPIRSTTPTMQSIFRSFATFSMTRELSNHREKRLTSLQQPGSFDDHRYAGSS